MPPLPGFASPSGTARSRAVSAERTVNLVLEPLPNQQGQYVLYGAPGLRPLATLPSAPVRGAYTTTGGRTFVTTSTTLFELFPGGTFLSRGTINTGTQPTSMVDDGYALVLSVDGVGYGYTLATDTLTPLPLTGPQSWGRVAYIDQRIVTNEPGTRRWWYSDFGSALGNALVWPPLNFIEADRRADDILTLYVDHGEVYLLGTQSMEVWGSTGDALSPFARNPSVFIEQGGESPAAIVAANSTLYWLGGSQRGEGPVFRLNGYTPERVSTAAIETAMGHMPTVGDCIATAASWGGHSFILWTFPTGNASWLLDTTLGSWTELADLADDGSLDAWRCYAHAFSAGEHVWGDRTTGELFTWDDQFYYYGDRPIYRERVTAHVRNDQKPVIYASFEAVMETGIGLDGAPPVGVDPVVMLSWSDDNGASWSSPLHRSAGRRGAGRQRVVWRRLGREPTQRAFAVRMTDPVPTAWISAAVEVS